MVQLRKYSLNSRCCPSSSLLAVLAMFLANSSPISCWYNTIQMLLSTPHGGFSETNINSTGNQKKEKKSTQELSINNY